MSTLFKRSVHYKRIPTYDGYWSLILSNANESTTALPVRKPIAVPIVSIIEEAPLPTPVPKPTKSVVYLKGKPIELPEKPSAPDNCCMSGCAHCVWDMYQEDMEEYNQEKNAIKTRFIEAGEPLPPSLLKHDPMEEMDPTMKAFLEMEKKLKK